MTDSGKPKRADSAEVLEDIRRAAREGRVKFAPSATIDMYADETRRLLDALHPGWDKKFFFVSDESCVSDFLFGEPKHVAAKLAEISEAVGVIVDEHDQLDDVVRRMRGKANA